MNTRVSKQYSPLGMGCRITLQDHVDILSHPVQTDAVPQQKQYLIHIVTNAIRIFILLLQHSNEAINKNSTPKCPMKRITTYIRKRGIVHVWHIKKGIMSGFQHDIHSDYACYTGIQDTHEA